MTLFKKIFLIEQAVKAIETQTAPLLPARHKLHFCHVFYKSLLRKQICFQHKNCSIKKHKFLGLMSIFDKTNNDSKIQN